MKNWLLSLVAATGLLATSSNVEAKVREQAKHKASHNDDSCCKSVKKGLKKANKELQKIEKLGCKLALEAPTPICQRLIDKAGGRLILYKSGDYCVTEDIVGTIIIAADSVCLDLCCHTLDAAGQASAVIANDHQALKVFDGRIINSSVAGILVTDYSSVELYNLTMSDHALDAIREETSIDLSVHDINFINDNSGERALFFDTCDNITVNHCNASGFLSTLGAIVQFDTCNAVSMQDVDVTNNTKSQAVPTGSFATDAAFVNANTCTGVDLVRVKVNNNIINTTAVGNRRVNVIGFVSSTSCSMHRCETSNNVDINGDAGNDLTQFAALDRQVFVGLSDNIVITEHQANNNSCTQPITNFRMYSTRDSNNTVFDGCQANSNMVQEFTVSPLFGSDLIGFFTQAVNVEPNGCAIRNCQANFNTVVSSGGPGRDPLLGNDGTLIGIFVEGGCIIDNCQTNNNTMGDSLPLTFVVGILVFDTSNVTISNCSADNNMGSESAFGVNISGGFGLDAFNWTVTNCSASSNGKFGLVVGQAFDTEDNSTFNVAIVDSVFNGNGNTFSDAAGIVVFPLTNNASNILIKGCQVYDTVSSNIPLAYSPMGGISVTRASNVVIEDTNVFNTTFVPPTPAPVTFGSKTGTGPFLVTFDIPPQLIPPLVGESYIVAGNSNPLYNGTFVATASTNTTITLSYAVNPGVFGTGNTTIILDSVVPLGGHGIVFNGLTDSKIIRTQLHGNQNSGVELVGANTTVAIIESIAMDNDIGFNFAAGSTASCCLVQDSRALSNTSFGFVHAPAPLTSVFIGNEAHCNGSPTTNATNYAITGGTISLQQMVVGTGVLSQIPPSNAALGARFTNLSVVP